MISINKLALKHVKYIMENKADLSVNVIKSNKGAKIIDMGVYAKGSIKGGLLLTKILLGGLADVSLGKFLLNEDYTLGKVEVLVDNPVLACVASQIAGLNLKDGDRSLIGAGPARAKIRYESDEYFNSIDYKDDADIAILSIQDNQLPSEELIDHIAEIAKVKHEDLYILLAKTNSIASAIQVPAKMLELVCHKLLSKDFDINKILYARGSAPIGPITDDEVVTMGRINDCLLYGSEAEFWMDIDDKEIERVLYSITGKDSSPKYGMDFQDIFEEANGDFYYIDRDVHSVGRIQIHNIRTGKSYSTGEINYNLLEESLT